MAATKRNRNLQKTYHKAAKRFQATGEALRKPTASKKRLLDFAESLRAISAMARTADSSTTTTLIDSLADQAKTVAGALGGAKSTKRYDLESVLRIANGLSAISGSLVELVNGLKLPCACNDDDQASRQELRNAGDTARNRGADTAYQAFTAAEMFYGSVGADTGDGDSSFSFPRLDSCCGRRPASIPVEGGNSASVPAPGNDQSIVLASRGDPIIPDEDDIALGLSELSVFLDELGELLIAIAVFVALTQPVVVCSSVCTPNDWRVTVKKTSVRLAGAGYQMMFDLDYEICCQNTCVIFSTDEFYKDVASISYTVNRLIPGIRLRSRRIALAMAPRIAAACAAFLTTTNGKFGAAAPRQRLTPALKYPNPVGIC